MGKLLPGVHFCRLATGAMVCCWRTWGTLRPIRKGSGVHGKHHVLSENSLIVASAKERKIWRILSAADSHLHTVPLVLLAILQSIQYTSHGHNAVIVIFTFVGPPKMLTALSFFVLLF